MPVLVFDQFEELFTLGAARGERRDRAVAFISELAELVENRPSAKLVKRLEQSPGKERPHAGRRRRATASMCGVCGNMSTGCTHSSR